MTGNPEPVKPQTKLLCWRTVASLHKYVNKCLRPACSPHAFCADLSSLLMKPLIFGVTDLVLQWSKTCQSNWVKISFAQFSNKTVGLGLVPFSEIVEKHWCQARHAWTQLSQLPQISLGLFQQLSSGKPEPLPPPDKTNCSSLKEASRCLWFTTASEMSACSPSLFTRFAAERTVMREDCANTTFKPKCWLFRQQRPLRWLDDGRGRGYGRRGGVWYAWLVELLPHATSRHWVKQPVRKIVQWIKKSQLVLMLPVAGFEPTIIRLQVWWKNNEIIRKQRLSRKKVIFMNTFNRYFQKFPISEQYSEWSRAWQRSLNNLQNGNKNYSRTTQRKEQHGSYWSTNLLGYFRGAVNELVIPELEVWILDKFNESDEEAPGVGSVHNQPLQQHSVKREGGLKPQPSSVSLLYTPIGEPCAGGESTAAHTRTFPHSLPSTPSTTMGRSQIPFLKSSVWPGRESNTQPTSFGGACSAQSQHVTLVAQNIVWNDFVVTACNQPLQCRAPRNEI